MKTLVIFVVLGYLLVGCSKSKESLVNDYFESLRKRDTATLIKYLDSKFEANNGDTTIDRSAFILRQQDEFFHEKRFDISDITDEDSLIRVKFTSWTPMDSALEVNTRFKLVIKFYFNNNKINKLIYEVDRDLKKEYNDEFRKKYTALRWFLEDKGVIDTTIANDDRVGYRNFFIKNSTKFNNANPKLKEDYIRTSFIRGTYTCNDCIYREIQFKGKSTCLVLGFYGTSYEVDEDYIRIKTDKGDLIFKIIDSNTLEGEGWAAGTYRKLN